LRLLVQPWLEMKDFALSDRVLPLHVHVNVRARRLVLRIENGGKGLRMSVPPGTNEQQICYFLHQYRGWIETKLKKFPPPSQDNGMLRHGVKLPYLGQPHLIVHQQGRGLTCLAFSEQNGKQILVSGEAAHVPRRLRDFLKNQATLIMTPLALSYAAKLGRKPKSIRYKDTKSRWGSCSAAGNLSFSWRIMMAPPAVMRYLVAHEVAHLVEMNHGRQFWQICTELCPSTQECRAWLKRNGQTLHAIDFY